MNNKAYVLILFGMDDYFNTIQAIRVKEVELNKISDVSISLCD